MPFIAWYSSTSAMSRKFVVCSSESSASLAQPDDEGAVGTALRRKAQPGTSRAGDTPTDFRDTALVPVLVQVKSKGNVHGFQQRVL